MFTSSIHILNRNGITAVENGLAAVKGEGAGGGSSQGLGLADVNLYIEWRLTSSHCRAQRTILNIL